MPQAALQRITDWESPGGVTASVGSPFGSGAACGTNDSHNATPSVTSRLIQLISSVRQVRREILPGALGCDPCWEILLQLYRAHLDQVRLNVSRLTVRTGLPATTILRGLETLAEAGFLAKTTDPLDRRMVIVALTETGVSRMNLFFVRTGTHAVLV